MSNRISHSQVINLFSILYFPFLYYGMVAVSHYFMVDTESTGGTVNYFGAFFNIVALLYIGIKGVKRDDSRKAIIMILLTWITLSFFNSLLTSSNMVTSLKNFNYGSMWATHFILYYFVVRYGGLNDKSLLYTFILLFLFGIILTFFLFRQRIQFAGELSFAGMNASYFVLCLFPWIFLVKRRWMKIFGIILVIAATMFSMKRTSLLALAVQLLPFLVFRKESKHVVLKFISSIVIIFVIYYLVDYINTIFLGGGITARFERAEDDNFGGRIIIWQIVLQKFKDSSIFFQMFGHGCESFFRDGGIGFTAHSDYFETLYDYGIIGLILLVTIIFQLCLYAVKILRQHNDLGISFMSSLLGFLAIITSSHLLFIHPCQIVFITALWGYAIGKFERQRAVRE